MHALTLPAEFIALVDSLTLLFLLHDYFLLVLLIIIIKGQVKATLLLINEDISLYEFVAFVDYFQPFLEDLGEIAEDSGIASIHEHCDRHYLLEYPHQHVPDLWIVVDALLEVRN